MHHCALLVQHPHEPATAWKSVTVAVRNSCTSFDWFGGQGIPAQRHGGVRARSLLPTRYKYVDRLRRCVRTRILSLFAWSCWSDGSLYAFTYDARANGGKTPPWRYKYRVAGRVKKVVRFNLCQHVRSSMQKLDVAATTRLLAVYCVNRRGICSFGRANSSEQVNEGQRLRIPYPQSSLSDRGMEWGSERRASKKSLSWNDVPWTHVEQGMRQSLGRKASYIFTGILWGGWIPSASTGL